MKLLDQIGSNEKVLWMGKKAFTVSILESIFNPLMPFALIWGLLDSSMFFDISNAGSSGLDIGMLGFFLIHMLPVWIYLGGVLTSAVRAKHTEYAVTD